MVMISVTYVLVLADPMRMGPLHRGDHRQVGANAVVTIDLPDTAVAIGVPARITAQQSD